MTIPAIAIQPVNTGSVPDDGTGDKLRLAFEKLNSNVASLSEVLAAVLYAADPEISTFRTIAQLIYAFNATVTALPAPTVIQKQITDAIAATIATLPTAAQIQTQINSATAAAVAGVPTAASIQAQITTAIAAALAGTDLSNYYTKNGVDALLAAIKGSADAQGDTLGELEALIAAAQSAIPGKASASDLRALSNDTKFLTAKCVADATSSTALTDAATVAVDLSTGPNFTLATTSAVGSTRTLGAPINLKDGQSGVIYVLQDATGSRLLAFSTAYKFPGGTVPTLSTGASAVDRFSYVVRGTRVECTALEKDFN